MAEAIAVFGVVAAGIQCAQAGLEVLIVGSSLRAKLQDAPEKVRKWLAQIEQLVALAELIKQTHANLPPSTLGLPRAAPPLSSAGSAATWIETALTDCTGQARDLQNVLKEMLHGVDDAKGSKIWRSILTLKRESRIVSALGEIERQKSMLNIWLGENNLRQLDAIRLTAQDFRDGIEEVDHHMLDAKYSFSQEFQSLSSAISSSSNATLSGLEALKNAGATNAESIGHKMQQYHGELLSESSAMQSQVQLLTREMQAIKREFRNLASFQARASRAPSLLQEALQDRTDSHALIQVKENDSKPRNKSFFDMRPPICSCSKRSWLGSWNLGMNIHVAVTNRTVHAEDCPAHGNTSSYFATIRCHARSTIPRNLLRLSFEVTCGAGGFSMGLILKPQRVVEKHHLEPFFRNLYNDRSDIKIRYIHDGKTYDELVRLTQRELWRAFYSGLASPDDVDKYGRTLLHLLMDCAWRRDAGIAPIVFAQVVRMLISMGCKTDVLDNRHSTIPQLLIETGLLSRIPGDQSCINEDVIEWTGILPSTGWSSPKVIECMRVWPESKEDWGYPYISDIVLRRSRVDLELFISRGLKPVEQTSRCLTPLHLAAAANWPEGVTLLLESGADKFAQDSNGSFPLNSALQIKCLQTIELLLADKCESYFTRSCEQQILEIPPHFVMAMIRQNEHIGNALAQTLIQLQDSMRTVPLYHILAMISMGDEVLGLVGHLFSSGFHDLEMRYKDGMTALMYACLYDNIQLAELLLEKGADPSTPHTDSAITAGYFLARYPHYGTDDLSANSETYAKLLQIAFSTADAVEIYCRCSPEGFTPMTVLRQLDKKVRRKYFEQFLTCLRWPDSVIEQQTRAFALREIFDRLQMKHTCVDIDFPSRQVLEEDRLEIEEEELEFYEQLQGLMEEYDLERAGFKGGPLEFTDFFFEMRGLSLPSKEKEWPWEKCNWNDKDLLGPGIKYQSSRTSFNGKEIFCNHKEKVDEEDMLALLFGRDHSLV